MRIAGAKARLRGNDAADDRARRKAANDGAVLSRRQCRSRTIVCGWCDEEIPFHFGFFAPLPPPVKLAKRRPTFVLGWRGFRSVPETSLSGLFGHLAAGVF
jgi:hypothetical protein